MKNHDRLYHLLQKIIGLVMLIALVIAVRFGVFYNETIQSNDCTAMILFIPVCLYLIFTKKNYFLENDNNK